MQATETTFSERIPAPPELAAKAQELVRAYYSSCFWFWRPGARVEYWDELPLVVEQLRNYGDWKAWKAAQDLQLCL